MNLSIKHVLSLCMRGNWTTHVSLLFMVVKKFEMQLVPEKKLRDTEYRETIVRLEHALGSDPESMVWHKSCYAQITDKSKIDRLRKKRDRESCCETGASTSAVRSVPRHLRRDFVPIKWEMCIFC